MDPVKELQEVAALVANCSRCPLSYSRKNPVPGEGPETAQMMLIGEGPGFYENEQGRPFMGAAGSFLNELLQKAGVNRETVFITNVVKCRPPGNRDPAPEELLACGAYLDRQIEAINPLIIITLGRFSMAKFLPNVRISEVHGKPAWVRGRLIIPMFHPAAALHQPSLKTSVERDFARLPEWMIQAQQAPAPKPDLEAEKANAGQIAEQAEPYQAPPSPSQAVQQPLLLEMAPPEPEPAPDEKASNGKDEPTQLSLF